MRKLEQARGLANLLQDDQYAELAEQRELDPESKQQRQEFVLRIKVRAVCVVVYCFVVVADRQPRV